MISSNSAVALEPDHQAGPPPRLGRCRRDWVRGDVRCLMCGRLIGRLLGSPGARGAIAFLAFRSVDTTQPSVACRRGMRFRCDICGGAGALDDLQCFATYDEPAASFEHEPTRPGPGRPPKQPRRPGPVEPEIALGLTIVPNPG